MGTACSLPCTLASAGKSPEVSISTVEAGFSYRSQGPAYRRRDTGRYGQCHSTAVIRLGRRRVFPALLWRLEGGHTAWLLPRYRRRPGHAWCRRNTIDFAFMRRVFRSLRLQPLKKSGRYFHFVKHHIGAHEMLSSFSRLS